MRAELYQLYRKDNQMANVCEFGLAVKGSESTLNELKAFLSTALEPCPGGYYGEFVLMLNQLWPDINKDENHYFVGLDCYREEGQPIVGPILEDGIHNLYLGGASKWCPPLGLMDRLSTMFPDLTFSLHGTTEHEQVEEWTGKAGELTVVEMWSRWLRGYVSIVYVRNGEDLDPPEFEGWEPGQERGAPYFSAEELVKNCVSIHNFFRPDRECPGAENGALLASAEKFVRRLQRERSEEKEMDTHDNDADATTPATASEEQMANEDFIKGLDDL